MLLSLLLDLWHDTVLARELHQAPRAIFGSRPVFLERGVIDAYVERAFSEKHPLVRFPPTLHAPAALHAPVCGEGWEYV
jgi:hypothetical protein